MSSQAGTKRPIRMFCRWPSPHFLCILDQRFRSIGRMDSEGGSETRLPRESIVGHWTKPPVQRTLISRAQRNTRLSQLVYDGGVAAGAQMTAHILRSVDALQQRSVACCA